MHVTGTSQPIASQGVIQVWDVEALVQERCVYFLFRLYPTYPSYHRSVIMDEPVVLVIP